MFFLFDRPLSMIPITPTQHFHGNQTYGPHVGRVLVGQVHLDFRGPKGPSAHAKWQRHMLSCLRALSTHAHVDHLDHWPVKPFSD